jgi:maleate isomerase
MTQRDNWGARARIGLFIVGNEAVPEAEWWAMAPADVSVHAARVTAKAPWAAWNKERSGVDPADDLLRGARQFAAMKLSAVTLGHTSSSVVGGKGWDDAAVKSVSAVIGPGTMITTNGLDTIAALKASAVKKPFVVLPAWFGEDFVTTAIGYYADHGFAPAGGLRYDPGAKWRGYQPGELTARGMHLEQEITTLHAQIVAACPTGADGVLIGGTGFRCVGILDALEQELGCPVISANQASLWHCLRLSGIKDGVTGYGGLFEL